MHVCERTGRQEASVWDRNEKEMLGRLENQGHKLNK